MVMLAKWGLSSPSFFVGFLKFSSLFLLSPLRFPLFFFLLLMVLFVRGIERKRLRYCLGQRHLVASGSDCEELF